MRAVLLRRMMVLAVCALGVSALYVVPGLTAQHRVGVPGPGTDVPPAPATRTPQPRVASLAAPASRTERPVAVEQPRPAEPVASRIESAPPTAAADPRERVSAAADSEMMPIDQPALRRPAPRAGSTPFDATPGTDISPPEPVTELALRDSDPEQLRIAWAPSSDDLGAVTYRIWLNGYEVASTDATEATLNWFNDDNAKQVLVVRAVDRAGNQSRSPAAIVLTRPEPAASSTPSSTVAASPSPASPSPASTASASPTPAASDPASPAPRTR